MNKKLRSTLGLVGLLMLIVFISGVYVFFFQRSKLNEKRAKLEELKANEYNTEQLTVQYQGLLKRSSVLDSILAARKFNIPKDLSSIKFYNFINNVSIPYSPLSQVDVEYLEQKQDKEFFYHEYKLSGRASYNDLFSLIYSIEQSKELKKITGLSLGNLVANDKDGIPNFLVGFTLTAGTYFSSTDRFVTASLVENNLTTNPVYDAFYPIIRNEIPPNYDELLDVQGAKLLALIPEGAFLSDGKGNTYLVWEGEPVYLGYLTKIDYERNRVSFILNKGGIIEKVELELEKEKPNK
ncbi:MAG: hypothetical protein A2V93_03015 [Ignavibacteria bacterium RBG_16_34_14]|nr:MAG: hypothetical protein A2V93_03015 [Ignavibacteria bacterium RBG_16_34_14]